MSNGRANGLPSIPATSRKMVQSLKEIVNCPEHEIYAMLKECNMDPNDTVNRLLSQDTFREVKSKREKKKEFKEGAESQSRSASSFSNRGGRGGSDRNVGRSGSTQSSSFDSGAIHGKPAYKKENGANTMPSSSSASGMVGNSRRSASVSESVSMENTVLAAGTVDGISLPSQPSPGFQSAWLGAPGQVSMAEIVKMGRPHRRASNFPVAATETSYSPHNAIMPNTSQHILKHPPVYTPTTESHHDLYISQDPVSKVSEIIHEPSVAVNQYGSHDDWSLAEQSPVKSGHPIVEPSGASVVYVNPSSSSSHVDRINLHLTSGSDKVRVTEGHAPIENLTEGHIESASASDRYTQVESSGGASHFDDSPFETKNSHKPQRFTFEHQEGIGGSTHLSVPDYPVHSSVEDVSVAVSSAAVNLQQLSLHRGELGAPPVDDNPAVIIPNHLQIPTADCSHLSFGSFGSGISATFPGSFASKNLTNNLEDTSVAADVSSSEHIDIRNAENYANELVISTSNENVESPSSSQPEVVKHDTAVEASQGHHYQFPSVSAYSFEHTAQTNTAAYSYVQANSQMQNLAPFSSVMQPYASSLPSNLMASNIQPLRESDIPYSPFLSTQSMPTKYSGAMSSISGPTMSMPEAVKPSVFSSPQPTPQPLPSTSIPTGSAVPQHLPMHPYAQPTFPLGHLASMVSFPYLAPNYTYLPSAFQQPYVGNSAYHQSPAAVHSGGVKYSPPQYKNSSSLSSLPQSAALASGYGGFGSSADIPGTFTLNPSTTPPSTTVGYEDVMSSQYKDGNHYGSLQQNEGSAMWVHGPGSRTISALPASTYYSLQGQNQTSGLRQGHQPSHYGALGYPNFYHSQTSVLQDRQQTASDGSLSASQGPPSQPSHQIWQHSY